MMSHRTVVAVVVLAAALVCASPAAAAPDNAGTDFWVGFMRNHTGGAEKSLFITGGTATTGTVSVPGLGFSQSFTVTPGSVTTVAIPAGAEMPGAEVKQDVGIHVTAADEVVVYGLNRLVFTTDAFLGLPSDVLGREYTMMAWGPGAGPSEVGVVATQDDTTVTITPSAATSGGHAAGTPYTVTLDAGEMYQVQAIGDLTGTTITATANVAVFGGHECANIPSSSVIACDHVVEQIPPDETWGTSFLTVPLKTRVGGDTVKFLATEDGTQVAVDGTTVATLNAGQQNEQLIAGQATITSNHPILVAQFSNGTSFDNVTSDPFMMLIPPFEQYQTGYTVTTPASGFAQNYLNLVVPDAAVGSIRVDGTVVPNASFTPIGSSGFQGAQLDIAVGSHTITGNGRPFGAFVYGFASADSYGYPGGLSLAPIASVTTIGLAPATDTLVVGARGCVTATVTDLAGGRVPGVRVDFAVAGANTATESVIAGDQGEAQFCYTATNIGNDTITASVGSVSGTATKSWVSSIVVPPEPTPPGETPPDRDRDGAPDATDNCLDAPNFDQADADGDRIGDACDDSDASGGPENGETVVAEVMTGTVFFRPPPVGTPGTRARSSQAARGTRQLKGAALLPMGSVLDTTQGQVRVTTDTLNRSSGRKVTEGSAFHAGIFQVRQRRARNAVTDITLRSPSATPYDRVCATGASASALPTAAAAQRSSRVVSRLWSNGRGNFRTRGRHSAATVRGTVWLTQNRCDGTRTQVRQGSVRVRDLRANRTVTVRAGGSYLARAVRATVRRRR